MREGFTFRFELERLAELATANDGDCSANLYQEDLAVPAKDRSEPWWYIFCCEAHPKVFAGP